MEVRYHSKGLGWGRGPEVGETELSVQGGRVAEEERSTWATQDAVGRAEFLDSWTKKSERRSLSLVQTEAPLG